MNETEARIAAMLNEMADQLALISHQMGLPMVMRTSMIEREDLARGTPALGAIRRSQIRHNAQAIEDFHDVGEPSLWQDFEDGNDQ